MAGRKKSQFTDLVGPRPRTQNAPTGTQIPISERDYQISFDPLAFDNFVRSQGIWVTHYKAVPDPRGMATRGDNRDVLANRPFDSDGFIYKKAGDLQVLFSTNSTYVTPQDLGTISTSVAYMTMPRFYPGTTEPVILHPWDKFYVKDIETSVINIQYLESRREGVERLQYSATKVEYLVDANGVWYDPDKDFEVTADGDIKWLTQKRPGWNQANGRGTVFAIRYHYTPYFLVRRLIHEIRISQITNQATYARTLERMPYQVEVMREIVYRDQNVTTKSQLTDVRFQNPPDIGGGYGPVGLPSVAGKLGPEDNDP